MRKHGVEYAPNCPTKKDTKDAANNTNQLDKLPRTKLQHTRCPNEQRCDELTRPTPETAPNIKCRRARLQIKCRPNQPKYKYKCNAQCSRRGRRSLAPRGLGARNARGLALQFVPPSTAARLRIFRLHFLWAPPAKKRSIILMMLLERRRGASNRGGVPFQAKSDGAEEEGSSVLSSARPGLVTLEPASAPSLFAPKLG